MGEPMSQPAGQSISVMQPNVSQEAQRVIDAGQRGANALARTIAAVGRINVIKAMILLEQPEAGSPEVGMQAAAVALVNHQLNLATKALDRAKDWNRKCQRRVGLYETSGGNYASLVKAIRYAHVVEKKAAAAENQAQWAEHYSVDENRYMLTDREVPAPAGETGGGADDSSE